MQRNHQAEPAGVSYRVNEQIRLPSGGEKTVLIIYSSADQMVAGKISGDFSIPNAGIYMLSPLPNGLFNVKQIDAREFELMEQSHAEKKQDEEVKFVAGLVQGIEDLLQNGKGKFISDADIAAQPPIASGFVKKVQTKPWTQNLGKFSINKKPRSRSNTDLAGSPVPPANASRKRGADNPDGDYEPPKNKS